MRKLLLAFLVLTFVYCGKNSPTGLEDTDGNVYKTVIIGNQEWMVENLKVTSYRNGDPIRKVYNDLEWRNISAGAYSVYDKDMSNLSTYGCLYNWYAVADSRNIAPEGWHVPTDDDWKELEMYLGMSRSEADAEGLRGTNEGLKLKEAGTSHWNYWNTESTGTNTSGFTALPGGLRAASGFFANLGSTARFWSSTESSSGHAWSRGLLDTSSKIRRHYDEDGHGFSVRCIKDK